MKVAVGFKVTPDYEALREPEWEAAAEAGAVDTRYVRRVLNCFDESALELALRLREARAERGAATSLAAFSVAGREAVPFLRTLQALGYEQAALVEPGGDLDFAPEATAALVAACTHELGGDVLLLGCRCGPCDSGTVPFLVAEALARPCLTQVTEVAPLDGDRLRVTWATDDGLLRATVRPPCVLAIGNAVVSRLRVPTLKDRLRVKGKPLAALSPAGVDVDVTALHARRGAVLTGLEAIERRRAGVVVGGATPREKAARLYDEHLRSILETL